MLKPFTEPEKKAIVKAVAIAVKDITKLTKNSYQYLSLCSGFIAHNNADGFKDYYTTNSLRDDLFANRVANQWKNFKPGDQNYDYMAAKADMYKRILTEISR